MRRRRSAATSAWVRPSVMTAVMTSLAFDMTEHRTHDRVSYVLRHGFPMSWTRTLPPLPEEEP